MCRCKIKFDMSADELLDDGDSLSCQECTENSSDSDTVKSVKYRER